MSAKASQSKTKVAKKITTRPAKSAASNAAKAAPANAKSTKRAATAPVSIAKKAFYFVAGDYEPRITDKKPKPSGRVIECPSFDEAKDQAVEQLIDLIDRCERRLWEIKRAESFEHYQQLAGND